MQGALLVCGLVAFLAVFFGLPETSHPKTRGIDKLHEVKHPEGNESKLSLRKLVWVNPLASLWLLRSPNLLAVVSGVKLIYEAWLMRGFGVESSWDDCVIGKLQ